MSIHQFQALSIDGEPITLDRYAGQILLIVNVASECGLTPQYEKLEALQRKYEDRGFQVLGFPCNQFDSQEPGSDAEIAQFCTFNFGVSFPMFSKIEVNGERAHPLYAYLRNAVPPPQDSTPGNDIRWNFTKFLVDRAGRVVSRHEPKVEPESLAPRIEALLG